MTRVQLRRSNNKTESTYEITIDEHADHKYVCFAISTLVHATMIMTKDYKRGSVIEPGKVRIRYTADITDDKAFTIYKFFETAISMLEEDFPEHVLKG